MRQFLLAILLASPAYAGGDDGFSGGGSAFGSSFGNGFSGGGYGDTMSANARDGFRGNSTVDSLQSFDDGHGGIRTYQHNPYHETDMLVSISGDGWGGYGGPSMPMAEGIGGRSVEQMLADKQAREAPRPTPMPTLYDPPAPPATDMGSVGTVVIDIQQTPPPSLGIIPDPIDVAVEAIGELVVTPDAPITPAEKNVARGLNLFAGIAAGIGAKGNNRLAHLAGKPKGWRNAEEGAIIGGTAAEAKSEVMGNKRFENLVQSFTRYTRDDLGKAKQELKNQVKDPERRAAVLDRVMDLVDKKEQRDRERKMGEAAERKGKGDGNGNGGKGGKGGKGKSN